MKKEDKYFLIGLSFLIALVIAYYFFFKKDKPLPKFTPSTQTNTTPTNCDPNNIITLNVDKILKVGVSGCEVKRLQNELNKNAAYTAIYLTPDGYFGDKTQSALMAVKGKTEITLRTFLNL